MALVTIRSPSVAASPTSSSNSDAEVEEEDGLKEENRECFFAGKGGTALLLSFKDGPNNQSERRLSTDSTRSTNSTQSNSSDIQQHLQSMFNLLKHEATLKMAVKLESQRPNRTRYLVIASRSCCRTSTTERRNKVVRHNSAKVTSSSSININTNLPMRQLSIDSHNQNKLHQNQQQQEQLQYDQQQSQLPLQTSGELNFDPLQSNLSIPGYGGNNNNNRLSLKGEAEKQNASGDKKNISDIEESCLLGIDCNDSTTIGLVVPILADTTIHLDGDGGFSVSVYGKTHIFKPVSVQAMWSALQTLHKVSHKARENNFYPGGPSHDWCTIYENRIDSDQSCLNEWNAMDSLESRRPPSPDAVRNKPTAKEETESVIKMKLKEIMMSVDLDEVTSKYIRVRLEDLLDMDLGEYKSFIDEEMLIILGQMDAPTEIFDHVYLGSEWNASNLEELQKNGVRHILNVTREIDNFFPGMFDYCNVRVYDDEKTNLLKHWDNTYRYITRAKAEGSKVLVHCKMGVSRSASVVIAYAMKAYNWEFQHALKHVKGRRNCVKPNKNFLSQLETYRGMLDAMKNKEKLQRSKSETNLKSTKDARLLPGSEPTPLIQALNQSKSTGHAVSDVSGSEDTDASSNMVNVRKSWVAGDKSHRRLVRRSSSTSPKGIYSQSAIVPKQQSQSLENLTPDRSIADEPRNVRFPASNGENYSVTQNQVLHIQKHTQTPSSATSVKTIIKDIEEKKPCNLQIIRSVSQDTSTTAAKSDIEVVTKQNLGSPVWTSSAKLITQTCNLDSTNPPSLRNSFRTRRDTTSSSISSSGDNQGDAFSAQVDSVFAKEEQKRHRRKTNSWAATSGVSGGIIMDASLGSTSSIDSTSSIATTTTSGGGSSGVGVNAFENIYRTRQRQRELPSRHSSWGSGDNRCGLPARNSSWSSYDTNRNTFQYGSNAATSAAILEGQIHELNMSNKTAPSSVSHTTTNMGTVKRTKQKLEENTIQKKLCQENDTPPTIESQNQETNLPDVGANVIKRTFNLFRSSSAAGSIRSRYPLRCNSEEFVSYADASNGSGSSKQQSNLRHSDTNRPLSSDFFNSESLPNSYTISDIENKNTVPQENDEDDNTVLLRNNQLISIEDQRISGNVQILKKSFEAKAGTVSSTTNAMNSLNNSTSSIQSSSTSLANSTKKSHQSLPSSPVAQHLDNNSQKISTAISSIPTSIAVNTSNTTATVTVTGINSGTTFGAANVTTIKTNTNLNGKCDRNVKGLVNKYQATSTASSIVLSQITATNAITVTSDSTQSLTSSNNVSSSNCSQNTTYNKPRPRSCYDSNIQTSKILSGKLHIYNESRPPPVPIKATTVTNSLAENILATQQQQQRRQQHGKTHPLARLSLPKQSFNTAAYNTM